MTKKKSQIIMMEHSEIKIKLLKLYLARYLKILSLTPHVSKIYLIDVYCGEGIYENDGEGSPIATLRLVKDITGKSGTNNKVEFHCRFNDNDSKKIEKLRSIIKFEKLDGPYITSLKIFNEQYKSFLSKVLVELNNLKSNERAFVFIDPYGYKDIGIAHIKQLLKNKKTEVLLFLPTQFMFRFEKKATPENLLRFIEELVPKEKWPQSDTGIKFIDNILEAFRESLGANHFVDSFILTREKNQFFCLFFFTSHIYGFDRMLEVKWNLDANEGRGWEYEEENLFSQIKKKPDTKIFERKLKIFLLEFRSNKEIYEFTLRNGHLPTHTTQILSHFQNLNEISIKSSSSNPIRKGSFYINWDNYKKKEDKIEIKLNHGTIKH